MKKILSTICLWSLFGVSLAAQPYLDWQRDYTWRGGYFYDSPGFKQNYEIKFNQDSIESVSLKLSQIPFNVNVGIISDTDGTFLFGTSGKVVADSTGTVMPNGQDIHPLNYDDPAYQAGIADEAGLQQHHSSIVLPDPGLANIFHVFHLGIHIQGGGGYSLNVYHTKIDRNLRGGLGDVVQNASPLLIDTLTAVMNACRHANGRDWWILVSAKDRLGFHVFLLDPSGVTYRGVQGETQRTCSVISMMAISSDGSTVARHYLDPAQYPDYRGFLEVFDFDRCAGTLQYRGGVTTPDGVNGLGVQFSPNSRMLYKVGPYMIHQYDLYANDWESSGIVVGLGDNVNDTVLGIPMLTWPLHPQLGPDDRMYISTYWVAHYLHVIDKPDERGLASDYRPRAIPLPTPSQGVPNMPNTFRLGAQVGSACDSLGIGNPAGLVTWPDTLDFGNLSPGQDSTLYLYAYNPGYTRTYLSYLHGHEPPFSTPKDHYRINPGDTLVIPVSFNSSVSGVFVDTMQVRNNVQDFSVALRTNVTGTVGLDKPSLANGIEFYPNPATEAFQLLGPASLQGGQLDMLDAQGRLVHRQHLDGTTGAWQISTQHLPAGLYLVNCRDVEGIQYSSKIMVND